MEYGSQFSTLLRELRGRLGVSQDIGRAIGLGHGVWESYEQGSKLPTIHKLIVMADRLETTYNNGSVPSQAEFLESWLQAHRVDIDEAILRALRDVRPHRLSLTEFSWLNAFTFTGERREQWARTRLDCLIEPAAISDLRSLHALGLERDTQLIPDKELTARPWEDLVKRYGDRDILSISSGAVNAMTGLLNDDMAFRFDVVAEARTAYRAFIRDMNYLERETDLRAFQQCLEAADRLGSSQDPSVLLREADLSADSRQFTRIANDVCNLLGGSTPSQFTSLFRQAVLDPLQRRRFQPERTFDYAVISFARHPLGGADRIDLVIAGTNGIATAGAVQLLANGGIEGCPLGAVVSVRVCKVEKDGNDVAVLDPQVVTPPYEPRDVVQSIESLIDARPAGGARTTLRGIFGNWTDGDLVEWRDLVVSLSDLLGSR